MAAMNELLSIGQVADGVGVRASAIRYYEATGLLPPPVRVSGQRRYERTAVDQLRLIRFCQQLGFGLSEIRQLLTSPKGKRAKQRWRELVDDKIAQTETAIARAQEMKRILEASRGCDCVSLDACEFLQDAGRMQPTS